MEGIDEDLFGEDSTGGSYQPREQYIGRMRLAAQELVYAAYDTDCVSSTRGLSPGGLLSRAEQALIVLPWMGALIVIKSFLAGQGQGLQRAMSATRVLLLPSPTHAKYEWAGYPEGMESSPCSYCGQPT